MMVMWDKKKTSVKELGEKLYLDSGTLTPVINKLESKGYIIKNRSKDDARGVDVELTDKGFRLQDDILSIPADMGKCVNISDEDAKQLYRILYTILDNLDEKE
jgi:DNA-binding MarR family transcriptional regulator